jgi:hypothetical protein
MKHYHLDEIIRKLKKACSGDDIDIDLMEMMLIAFEEIKKVDEKMDEIFDELS